MVARKHIGRTSVQFRQRLTLHRQHINTNYGFLPVSLHIKTCTPYTFSTTIIYNYVNDTEKTAAFIEEFYIDHCEAELNVNATAWRLHIYFYKDCIFISIRMYITFFIYMNIYIFVISVRNHLYDQHISLCICKHILECDLKVHMRLAIILTVHDTEAVACVN